MARTELGPLKEVLDEDEGGGDGKKKGKRKVPKLTEEETRTLGAAQERATVDATKATEQLDAAKAQAMAKRVPDKFKADVDVLGDQVDYQLESFDTEKGTAHVDWRSLGAMKGTERIRLEKVQESDPNKTSLHYDLNGALRLPDRYFTMPSAWSAEKKRDWATERFAEVAQAMLTKDDLGKVAAAEKKFNDELPKIQKKDEDKRLAEYERLEQAVANATADRFQHAMERLKVLADELKKEERVDVLSALGGWDAWSKKQKAVYDARRPEFIMATLREVELPKDHAAAPHEHHGDHEHGPPKKTFVEKMIYDKGQATKQAEKETSKRLASERILNSFKEAEKIRYGKMTPAEKKAYYIEKGKSVAGAVGGFGAAAVYNVGWFFSWGYGKLKELWTWLDKGSGGGGGGHKPAGGGHGGGGHH